LYSILLCYLRDYFLQHQGKTHNKAKGFNATVSEAQCVLVFGCHISGNDLGSLLEGDLDAVFYKEVQQMMVGSLAERRQQLAAQMDQGHVFVLVKALDV